MNLLKWNISIQSENEPQYIAFGGKYKDGKNDSAYLLTHPIARTLWKMKNLETAEEQFEFYCFAYLRMLLNPYLAHGKYEKAFNKFVELKEKFGMPWNGNVHHTLPAESMIDPEVLTKEGINVDLLKEKFNQHADYEFILYPFG